MVLRLLFVFSAILSLPLRLLAQNPVTPEDSLRLVREKIEKSFTYQTGKIDLGKGLATLEVPQGYRYLSARQSQYVLNQLWGNPPDSSTLGLLFPANTGPFDENTYAIDISYSEEGYIDDDDAKDLNYEDLLKEMQQDTRDANPARVQAGYESIELIKWASAPYYDSETHKLHWAKELKFSGAEQNTLNYNIRILGRKGYLMLNVIGDITILPIVKKDIPNVLASVDFTDGNRYSDFNPDMDKVAAYGVGGLIAGKVLAKVGFFALALKFWKVIAAVLLAAFYYLKKLLFGKKPEEEMLVSEPATEPEPNIPV
jgi:uncharacterized membrane-anchored protein